MFSFVTLSILGVVLVAGLQWYRDYRKYIEQARKTGMKYVLTPYPANGYFWGVVHELLSPPLRKLSFTSSWRWLRNESWKRARQDHEQLGDTYFIVAPNGLTMRTGNAELSAQISHRRSDFMKPVRKYRIIDIFGRSIVSTEGSDWRRHRKVVGPSFSEKSNKLVFEESLRQALGIMALWSSQDGNIASDIRVQNTAVDTAVLSLHVICAAGFGLPQLWPGESREKVKELELGFPGMTSFELSGDHTMTFKESMHSLLQGLRWFVLLPDWLIKNSPLQTHKNVYEAYSECLAYFKELRELKKKQLHLGEHDDKGTMDLMGPMIRASDDGVNPDSKTNAPILTDSEIVGNSFIFFFAGHETTGNAIHFSLLYLALSLSSQRAMQADIDRIIGSKPTSEITYYKDMPRLYNSMVGAVLNEEIRLMPGILSVPKEASGDQRVTVDGREFTIPDWTSIQLNVTGTNRNPRYWPCAESKITPGRDDLNDFVPERWLSSSPQAQAPAPVPEDKNDDGIDGLEHASFDTSSPGSLFKPSKGSFMTFADGMRACPGRRFAQVEVTAVLTAIFQRYSIELDVGAWASDEEVARMGVGGRKAVYGKAVERARWVLGRCEQRTITLQMKKGDQVPVRFFERGCERFAGIS